MAVSEEHIRQLADLSVGREPNWLTGGPSKYPTQPPASSSDMLSLALTSADGYAVVCPIEVLLREDPSLRTARASIQTFDLTTDYTVTLDGNAHTINGTTDIEATIDLIVADVNAGRTGTGTETESGRSKVVLGTIDAATTYTVTIDGLAFALVGDTDKATTAAALLALLVASDLTDKLSFALDGSNDLIINNLTSDTYTLAATAASGTGTISFVLIPVVASREGSGDSSVLLLQGTGSPDYTVVLSEATGSGRWALLEVDATAVTIELWGLSRNRTTPVALSGQTYEITTNWSERIAVAGLTHVLPVLTVTDGRVSWAAGPADLEA